MSVRFLLLLAAAAGCHRPTQDGTHTGHTGGEDTHSAASFDGFRPSAFGVTAAAFAVDDQGRATGWTDAGGNAVPATLALTLVDATWIDGATDENHCEFTWTWSTPIDAVDSPATPAFARWNPRTEDGARLTETCSALEFPPRWGGDVPAAVGSWEFGAGVGPLNPGVRDSLEVAFGDDFDRYIPYVAGGGFWWDGFRDRTDVLIPEQWASGWVDTAVVYAYALDASGREILDGGLPVQLLAEDVPVRGGVAPGRYQLQGTTLVNPAEALIPPAP